MDLMNKIIYSRAASIPINRIKRMMLIYAFIGVIVLWGIFDMFTFILLVLVFFLFVIIIEIIGANYDGWVLDDDKIIIEKNTFLKGRQFIQIALNKIHKIAHNEALILYTDKNKYIVGHAPSAMELAATLKFLQSKGIEIVLHGGDYEVELYLQGKIDALPMNNENEGEPSGNVP